MQEIANEAGINKALLHYYYRSKQLLFEAVFKKVFMLLAPEITIILSEDCTIEEKIRKFTHSYINFVIKHPFLPNFIIHEINRNPKFIQQLLKDNMYPKIGGFKKQVEQEIGKGHIKPIRAEQLFINIIALNAFPFVAAPLIKGVLQIPEKDFKQIMEDRKTQVADFIINAIKI